MSLGAFADDIAASPSWRPIAGFNGLYAVSAYGEVFSYRLGRRLKQCIDKDGYPRVVLRVSGQHYTRKVHRLVAEAFHGDKKNALHREVDHIDRNRANAAASNLRWVSRGENMHRRTPNSHARGERAGNARLTASAVREIRERRQPVKVLAEKFGVSNYAIYDVLRGRRWAHVE